MNVRKPETSLTDGAITLVPLGADHVDSMEKLGYDDAVLANTYVTAPWGPDKALAWVARYVEGWSDGSRAGFAVEDAVSTTFLGFCALIRIEAEAEQAEIGYITAPEARGRGVAARSLRLISEWAFEALGMKRLELRIATDNPASAAVAERAGYEREGTFRSIYFKQGMRTDLFIYSRIA